MASNQNLHAANKAKKDEFYTQLADIENETRHYREHFRGKTVLCNCDDPYESNFFKYFAMSFRELGLKKLIATCYSGSPIVGGQISLFDIPAFDGNQADKKQAFKIEMTEAADLDGDGAFSILDVELLLKSDKNTLTLLNGNGDFRSPECVELLKEADVVVTNPPFSLFREYVAQLVEYDKKFLIIGNQNCITYKEIFPYIMQNKIWLGVTNGGTKWFQVPMDYDIATESRKKIVGDNKFFSMGSIYWFTNLDHAKRHEEIVLYKRYTPEDYPKYDNYDAINVNKVSEIPEDYEGVMGVPITFLDKYNPEQFEIVAFRKGADGKDLVYSFADFRAVSDTPKTADSDPTQPNPTQPNHQDYPAILQNSRQEICCDQIKTRELVNGLHSNAYSFATSIPGMIKNAEGKIGGVITYARITIRKRNK